MQVEAGGSIEESGKMIVREGFQRQVRNGMFGKDMGRKVGLDLAGRLGGKVECVDLNWSARRICRF